MNRTDIDKYTENYDKTDQKLVVWSEIVCRENQSEYRYVNKSRHRVAKVKIDSGLISAQNQLKCDWLIIDWNKGISYFIELKGDDLRHAIKQIEATLDSLMNDLRNAAINQTNGVTVEKQVTVFEVRIVLSKVSTPKIMTCPERKKLEKRISKTIRIGSQQLIDTV